MGAFIEIIRKEEPAAQRRKAFFQKLSLSVARC
jgi:hypothetical protein